MILPRIPNLVVLPLTDLALIRASPSSREETARRGCATYGVWVNTTFEASTDGSRFQAYG